MRRRALYLLGGGLVVSAGGAAVLMRTRAERRSLLSAPPIATGRSSAETLAQSAATTSVGSAQPPQQPPPRIAHPPAETWAAYVHPAGGFSIKYPANWYVDPPVPPARRSIVGGSGVSVWNWTPNVQVKRPDRPDDEIKLGVSVMPELRDYEQPGGIELYRDLDDWLARRQFFHPDAQFHDVRETRLDGRRAVAWTAEGGLAIGGTLALAAAERDSIYVLTAIPAFTQYRWVFDEVVRSFRFL